jgi:hypothetical protein
LVGEIVWLNILVVWQHVLKNREHIVANSWQTSRSEVILLLSRIGTIAI